MKINKLSIVIPCFNCSKTLEQAVGSIYQQKDLTVPFEVIIVNDASTDNTSEVIYKLQKLYSEIKIYNHVINKGGAAARNTGIRESSGEVIYCLDGDNFFTPNSVQMMLSFIEKNSLDGAAFHERRFFVGNNHVKYNAQINNAIDRDLYLSDLFDSSDIILDNFFFTKESWSNAGEFPENNNFDTQCFELRYLMAGNRIRFCPDSSFYHRQFSKDKSYFERVYDNGDFSRNFYLIYREMFHLFSENIRRQILSYNIFSGNSLAQNIRTYIRELYQRDSVNFFNNSFGDYVKPHSLALYCDSLKIESAGLYDKFCLYINGNKSVNVNELYRDLFSDIKNSETALMYDYLRNCLLELNMFDSNKLDRDFFNVLNIFIAKKRQLNKTLFQRIISKLYEIV